MVHGATAKFKRPRVTPVIISFGRSRFPRLRELETTVSALAVLLLKPGDNAAQLTGYIALESRNDQEVRVTISPPAINAPISVKISCDAVTVKRADAVRKAEATPDRK